MGKPVHVCERLLEVSFSLLQLKLPFPIHGSLKWE